MGRGRQARGEHGRPVPGSKKQVTVPTAVSHSTLQWAGTLVFAPQPARQINMSLSPRPPHLSTQPRSSSLKLHFCPRRPPTTLSPPPSVCSPRSPCLSLPGGSLIPKPRSPRHSPSFLSARSPGLRGPPSEGADGSEGRLRVLPPQHSMIGPGSGPRSGPGSGPGPGCARGPSAGCRSARPRLGRAARGQQT